MTSKRSGRKESLRPGANSAPARTVSITVDGTTLSVASGTSVAAALLNNGVTRFRDSETGEPRAPVCGMGICFECRVTIDGEPHQRACLIPVREGMHVATAFGA